MLLGAVSSHASPRGTDRGRVHVDDRLGDDLVGRIDYLEPDVVARRARAGCRLKSHTAASDGVSQAAGEIYLRVGCPGRRGERRAVLVECFDVAVQFAAGVSGDREAERDGTFYQRLGAAGENLEGHPSFPVVVLDCGHQTRLVGDLGTGGVNGIVVGEVGIVLVQRSVQGSQSPGRFGRLQGTRR